MRCPEYVEIGILVPDGPLTSLRAAVYTVTHLWRKLLACGLAAQPEGLGDNKHST
jgi:hypothetical protein